MQNRFGKFDGLFTKKLFYHQGFFAVKRRVVFILGAKWIHVAPRLFFMFFVFDSIDDSAKLPIWRNLSNFVAKIHNHEVKTDEDRTNRFGQSPRDVSTDGRCYRPLVPTDMP